ncbi:hypothetical protein [Sinorhizobium terangae]|uniref:hypothetical protein n=1 Tax=Sinorhizobium terangae TaxID=110322 RepID=UPI0024B0EE8F|nr:hypothetical protein [Sinorhizobium terangae]WFU51050.1 hypothetical protein QA637_20810 [Sinorhizobium terangae]
MAYIIDAEEEGLLPGPGKSVITFPFACDQLRDSRLFAAGVMLASAHGPTRARRQLRARELRISSRSK